TRAAGSGLRLRPGAARLRWANPSSCRQALHPQQEILMRNRSFVRHFLAGLGMMAASLVMMSAAQAQKETTFVPVDPPQATSAADKIEVLEFFQYGCPHCRAMEPLVHTWLQKQSDDVQLQRVPVAF